MTHSHEADTEEFQRDYASDTGEVSQPLTPGAYATERPECPECFGTGHMMTTNDYLRKLVSYLPTGDPAATDELILDFYQRLLTAAPYLASMFPDDLLDPNSPADSGGRTQRDSLLSALVSVVQTYDPDAPAEGPGAEAMQVLNTHLAAAGRSHFAFLRESGKVRGAMVQEYAAVIALTIATLKDAVGIEWRPIFEDVMNDALDYASRKMLRAQDEWLEQHPNPVPRRPRPSR